MVEILAGAPFYIAPSEIMAMTWPDLEYWINRACARLKMDSHNGSNPHP